MEGIDTCIPDCPYCRHRPPPLHHFSFSSPPHCPNCLNHWYTFNYGFPATASSAYPYKSPPPESPPPLPPPPPSNLPPEPSKPPPPPHQVRRRRREPTRSRSEIEKACVEHFQKRRVEAKAYLSKVNIPIGENPAWSDPSLYLMGLQTCIVIIWTAMVIPSTLAEVIGGGNVEKAEAIQMSLFTAAVNTGLQVLFGSQLPVVMQISQAFINAAISIAVSINNKFGDTLTPRQRFEESMRRIQGASIIGSFLQIIIGYSGLVEIFVSKLDLVASIPLVTLTGLELRDRGFPQMMKCTAIGLPALAIMIFSTHVSVPLNHLFPKFSLWLNCM
ncbi:nucleobase-ascorbate transporter 4-like [Manihot esculenta]|uniref:nucleobase-ascorbate transporter 4-like n=1 Tax=Manihot esculenta TaxID=3983 RepID=UPI001CC4C333|nr:nucleobase-ascorbate transporter 4-like [Manihot esculenta]